MFLNPFDHPVDPSRNVRSEQEPLLVQLPQLLLILAFGLLFGQLRILIVKLLKKVVLQCHSKFLLQLLRTVGQLRWLQRRDLLLEVVDILADHQRGVLVGLVLLGHHFEPLDHIGDQVVPQTRIVALALVELGRESCGEVLQDLHCFLDGAQDSTVSRVQLLISKLDLLSTVLLKLPHRLTP